MKLTGYKADTVYGNIILRFTRENAEDFTRNGIFDPSLSKEHVVPVLVGDKDKLVEVAGQQLADAIEAEYWTEELVVQQENLASPA